LCIGGHGQWGRFGRGRYRQAGIQRRLRNPRCSFEVGRLGDLLRRCSARLRTRAHPAHPRLTSRGRSVAAAVARTSRARDSVADEGIIKSAASAVDHIAAVDHVPADRRRPGSDSKRGRPKDWNDVGCPNENTSPGGSYYRQRARNDEGPQPQGRESDPTWFPTNIKAWQWSRMSSTHESRPTEAP
jgi:hypothetical protein